MTEGPRPPAPDGEAPTPHWVYIAGIAVLLVALALIVMHLSSGGVPMPHR